jgi:hypothetical protein
MTESCSCAAWEGTGAHHIAVFPDEPFETLEREDLGDVHGATPHRGRLRCRKCGTTFAYSSELTSTVVTRESDADRVIVAFRGGKTAQVGGGRSFSTYGMKDGQPIMITSDDGYTEEIAITEERLREVIATDLALFLDYLRMWQR